MFDDDSSGLSIFPKRIDKFERAAYFVRNATQEEVDDIRMALDLMQVEGTRLVAEKKKPVEKKCDGKCAPFQKQAKELEKLKQKLSSMPKESSNDMKKELDGVYSDLKYANATIAKLE